MSEKVKSVTLCGTSSQNSGEFSPRQIDSYQVFLCNLDLDTSASLRYRQETAHNILKKPPLHISLSIGESVDTMSSRIQGGDFSLRLRRFFFALNILFS